MHIEMNWYAMGPRVIFTSEKDWRKLGSES
jgi:hypothetical protein